MISPSQLSTMMLTAYKKEQNKVFQMLLTLVEKRYKNEFKLEPYFSEPFNIPLIWLMIERHIIDINCMYETDSLIHKAVRDNDIQMMQFLLQYQCKLNTFNKQSQTPLDAALEYNNHEIARLLIYNGAICNLKKDELKQFLHVPIHQRMFKEPYCTKTSNNSIRVLILIGYIAFSTFCTLFLFFDCPYEGMLCVSLLGIISLSLMILLLRNIRMVKGILTPEEQLNLLIMGTRINRICQACRIIHKKQLNDDQYKHPHCYRCDQCVENRSHHCIWINKCIGQSNKLVFNIFYIVFFTWIIMQLILSPLQIKLDIENKTLFKSGVHNHVPLPTQYNLYMHIPLFIINLGIFISIVYKELKQPSKQSQVLEQSQYLLDRTTN